MDPLKKSLAQRRRVKAGRRFEESLERQHAEYLARGLGKILPHYPRTIRTPRGPVYAKGGAPIDFSGVIWVPDAGKYAVAFDAKVKSAAHQLYRHPLDQRHQIIQLLDFHKAGAIAFLLFEDLDHGRCLLVHGRRTFETLIRGQSVRLSRGEEALWPITEPRMLFGNVDWRAVLPELIRNPDPELPE